jgi:hypothetical protein
MKLMSDKKLTKIIQGMYVCNEYKKMILLVCCFSVLHKVTIALDCVTLGDDLLADNELRRRNLIKKCTILTSSVRVAFRVARWNIFKPKIPMWVNFGGSCNGRFWYIL